MTVSQVLEGLVGWPEVIVYCSLAAFSKSLKTCIGKVESLYPEEFPLPLPDLFWRLSLGP